MVLIVARRDVRQAGAVPALPVEVDRGVAAARGTGGGRRAFWPRPRVRRALDVVRLVLSAAALAGLVALATATPDGLAASADLLPGTVTGLPRTLLSVANVVASFAVICLLAAVVVDALRWRRFALTSAVLACVAALLAAILMARLVTSVAGRPATSALVGPGDESSGLPVGLAIAFLVGADLQRRRWLRPAFLALAVAVVCAVVLGSLTPPGAAYAALLGTTAGLGVRVAVGVVPAHPPPDLVRSVLERAGYRVHGLREIEQTVGLVRYVGERADGDSLAVSVIDPDWRGVPFTRRAWRLLWLRTAAVGRPALSMRGQVERQALIGGLAEAAGVPTPQVLALLAAGPALVQVERPLRGTPLSAAPLPERAAESAWRALRTMHDAGIAHGALTPRRSPCCPTGGPASATSRRRSPRQPSCSASSTSSRCSSPWPSSSMRTRRWRRCARATGAARCRRRAWPPCCNRWRCLGWSAGPFAPRRCWNACVRPCGDRTLRRPAGGAAVGAPPRQDGDQHRRRNGGGLRARRPAVHRRRPRRAGARTVPVPPSRCSAPDVRRRRPHPHRLHAGADTASCGRLWCSLPRRS